LYRIGRVLHLSRDGNLVVKAETKPRIGAEAYNAQLKFVGVVSDVIGPTRSPYVIVKVKTDEKTQFVNQSLYVKTMKGSRF